MQACGCPTGSISRHSLLGGGGWRRELEGLGVGDTGRAEEPGEHKYFIRMLLAGTEGRDGREPECRPEDSVGVG